MFLAIGFFSCKWCKLVSQDGVVAKSYIADIFGDRQVEQLLRITRRPFSVLRLEVELFGVTRDCCHRDAATTPAVEGVVKIIVFGVGIARLSLQRHSMSTSN